VLAVPVDMCTSIDWYMYLVLSMDYWLVSNTGRLAYIKTGMSLHHDSIDRLDAIESIVRIDSSTRGRPGEWMVYESIPHFYRCIQMPSNLDFIPSTLLAGRACCTSEHVFGLLVEAGTWRASRR
jgi:hypothetical protein